MVAFVSVRCIVVEIIQQNPGPYTSSREVFEVSKTTDGKWKMKEY